MSLRCLGPDGQTIHSFDLTVGEWSALRRENGGSLQLRMPCCDASVVMKTSTRGLNFFAHKSRGPCQSAPETEEHLALKMLAVEAARRAGWVCSTEARGASSSGEPWIADVLAQKGSTRLPLKFSGQVKHAKRPCIAKHATGSPAFDACGCFGSQDFLSPKTCPPLMSVERSPRGLRLGYPIRLCHWISFSTPLLRDVFDTEVSRD
jgi:hypothetical protein